MLENIYHKSVLSVGQLVNTRFEDDKDNATWQRMKEWLDNQECGSVLYVVFGSKAKQSQD